MSAKPPSDALPQLNEKEAVSLASDWARHWLQERKSPPGHQLHRSIVQDEALVPANWERALTVSGDVGDGIDADKLPLFGGGDSHYDYDDEKGKVLADRAHEGDRIADAALAYIARKHLLAGRPMPNHLTNYVIDLLTLRCAQHPPRKKGGDPYANLARDMFIVGALSKLDRLGFSPTKNEATDKPTGSFILAQALQQLGFDIDYPGVAKVWRKRRGTRPFPKVAARYPQKAAPTRRKKRTLPR